MPHKQSFSLWIISFCVSFGSYMLDVVAISAQSVLQLCGVIQPGRRQLEQACADRVGESP
jgi:hypothetical protein